MDGAIQIDGEMVRWFIGTVEDLRKLKTVKWTEGEKPTKYDWTRMDALVELTSPKERPRMEVLWKERIPWVIQEFEAMPEVPSSVTSSSSRSHEDVPRRSGRLKSRSPSPSLSHSPQTAPRSSQKKSHRSRTSSRATPPPPSPSPSMYIQKKHNIRKKS